MEEKEYIKNFEKLGFGLFVHFGLYSIVGKGEWYEHWNPQANVEEYEKLTEKFYVKPDWARQLVKTAKRTGCKYITLTTRHHDGFSLFDTCGLSTYDAPHSACGRDLIAEFVSACKEEGIVPFFYHTLLDWWHPAYKNDFSAYIDYLVASIEILCKNYGKVGGFWFDGMWDKPDEDWQEDRLYGTIRKYQPDAMIINNTGLSALGQVGHYEIDSVTFERGNPCFVDNSDKHRAGEMCQILNDHWGYSKNDYNYKAVKELIENLVDCRKYNCNFLLNTGLKGNGYVNGTDKILLRQIGKWVKKNKGFIYDAKSSSITATNADILEGEDCFYAVIKNARMGGDPNVVPNGVEDRRVSVDREIHEAIWLDNGRKIPIENNSFSVESFAYGESYSARVAKIKK